VSGRHDASQRNMNRYTARLVAQGFNQVPGRDFDETWTPVPSSATTGALFGVAAAKYCEFHHVDVKTALPQRKNGQRDVHQAPGRSRAGGGI